MGGHPGRRGAVTCCGGVCGALVRRGGVCGANIAAMRSDNTAGTRGSRRSYHAGCRGGGQSYWRTKPIQVRDAGVVRYEDRSVRQVAVVGIYFVDVRRAMRARGDRAYAKTYAKTYANTAQPAPAAYMPRSACHAAAVARAAAGGVRSLATACGGIVGWPCLICMARRAVPCAAPVPGAPRRGRASGLTTVITEQGCWFGSRFMGGRRFGAARVARPRAHRVRAPNTSVRKVRWTRHKSQVFT